MGLPVNGSIAFGQACFLPSTVLVGAARSALGSPAAPGDQPYLVTTTTRVATVPVTPELPSVSPGEAVSIVMPDGSTTPGHVSAIGALAPGQGGSGNGGGGSQPQASAAITVLPEDPASTGTGVGTAIQVSLTTQSARNVLAVPITALLALAGGGYGVEVVAPSGSHHLEGVTTGIFTGAQVQITGGDLSVGTKVVVAQ